MTELTRVELNDTVVANVAGGKHVKIQDDNGFFTIESHSEEGDKLIDKFLKEHKIHVTRKDKNGTYWFTAEMTKNC